MKSLSHVRLLATPWTVAYQAPPSMGFSRQEYWRGVPLPSLGRHGLYLVPFVSPAPAWWIRLSGSLTLIPFLSLKASLSYTEHQSLSTTYQLRFFFVLLEGEIWTFLMYFSGVEKSWTYYILLWSHFILFHWYQDVFHFYHLRTAWNQEALITSR